MLNLPLFVGIDYPINTIKVCAMNQQGNILANQAASWVTVFPHDAV